MKRATEKKELASLWSLVATGAVLLMVTGYFLSHRSTLPPKPEPQSIDIHILSTTQKNLQEASTTYIKSSKKIEEKYPFSSYQKKSDSQRNTIANLFDQQNALVCNSVAGYIDILGYLSNVGCVLLGAEDDSGNVITYQDKTLYYSQLRTDAVFAEKRFSNDMFSESDVVVVNKFILKNSTFFGITDNAHFKLVLSDNKKSLSATQMISGIAIRKIEVNRTGAQVLIFGHFIPHAYLPPSPKISLDEITQRFLGSNYTYQSRACIDDFYNGCHPPQVSRIITTDNITINLSGAMCDSDKNTEQLRLAYLVKITLPYTESPGSYQITKVIDAMTGEDLAIDSL